MFEEQEKIRLMRTNNGFALVIEDTINKKNMDKIIKLFTHALEMTFNNDMSVYSTIEYHMNSCEGDVECLFTFNDFLKESKIKYPNLTFRAVAYYINGIASLMYMLADERISTPKTYVSFSNNFEINARNKISKILFEKGYNVGIINNCLPKIEEKELIYCTDVCVDKNFSTEHINFN